MELFLIIFMLTFLMYLFSALGYIAYFVFKKNGFFSFAFFVSMFGFLLQTASLVTRAVISGFLPMSNLFESLCIFSWMIVFAHIFIELKYRLKIIGTFVMPVVFVIMGYAALLDKNITPLMPALQSAWLGIHVSFCFISYACFTGSFILGLIYLIQEDKIKHKNIGFLAERLPSLDVADVVAYRLISFGFPFLTLGIITGSIWAEQAWGSWWSWDPKETWSLVTGLIYAVYLHARLMRGFRGRKAAYLAIIGFLAVLFTYLGVSYLLPGLHSYI